MALDDDLSREKELIALHALLSYANERAEEVGARQLARAIKAACDNAAKEAGFSVRAFDRVN